MNGKLYGIGVGPGDSELITLKALRIIKETDIIAVPGENPREAAAYKIAEGAWKEIDNKNVIAINMPMTKDRSEERRVGKECRSRWSPYH